MLVLSTYDYGVKKYLSENDNGYIIANKEFAKIFTNQAEALKVKNSLLNKEDFL